VAGVAVAESAPGLFTTDGSGLGQALAFNLPGGEPNSSANPAPRGSEIRLFATGLGLTVPPADQPRLPVSVKIGNTNAAIRRIARSPGAAQGLFEIDVAIPSALAPSSAAPVIIQAGSASSADQVTIAVR
jgi:uncharacterized protein (TIGR03437 family)